MDKIAGPNGINHIYATSEVHNIGNESMYSKCSLLKGRVAVVSELRLLKNLFGT